MSSDFWRGGTGLEPVPRINEEWISNPPQYQLCLTLHIKCSLRKLHLAIMLLPTIYCPFKIVLGDISIFTITKNVFLIHKKLTVISITWLLASYNVLTVLAIPMGLEPMITWETVRRISHYATEPYGRQFLYRATNSFAYPLLLVFQKKIYPGAIRVSLNFISCLQLIL